MTNRAPSTLQRTLAAVAAAWLLIAASFAHANGRVALLVGNAKYPTSPLRNSINDVRDLGAVLRELGFRTIVKEDATRTDMFAAIQEFGKAIEGADAALFFYAGHAMQFKDRNYLIPIDAVMSSEDDVTFFSIDVSQVFDRMERAKTRFNFVVLDACRDNPFRDTFRVSASGLAQMSGPSGTLIAYATAPGATAQDGYARNGTYTSHILQNIKIPDMPVEVLFRKVREGVERETKRLQTPWELSSIRGEFVFNPSGRVAGAPAGAGPSADTSAQFELSFWNSVQGSSRAEDLQAYLDKYPNGNFAVLARNRIDAILGRTRPPPAATVAAASPPPAVAASSPPASAPASANTALPGASPPPSSPAVRQPANGSATSMAAAPSGPPAVPRTSSGEPAARPADAATQVAAAAASAPPPAKAPSSAAEPSAPSSSPVLPPPRAKDEQPGREIAPGIREVTFNDGSVYRGAMRGIQLHGKGAYSSKTFKYEGEYQDGKMHGQGAYQWENGDRYEGEFAQDRPNGKGRYQFGNGDSYEGEVRAGVVAGRGIYVTKGGDRIEGSFAEGKPSGVGIYRFTSGDRYEGEMVAGRLQGKGRYYTKSGDRIEGTFENGLAQGKGTYLFANGDRYDGDLKDGIPSGVGTYLYSSGSKYEGEFVSGGIKGKGVYWFPDGSRFEGVFENGMAKARGESVSADGKRVPAEVVDGLVRHLPS